MRKKKEKKRNTKLVLKDDFQLCEVKPIMHCKVSVQSADMASVSVPVLLHGSGYGSADLGQFAGVRFCV